MGGAGCDSSWDTLAFAVVLHLFPLTLRLELRASPALSQWERENDNLSLRPKVPNEVRERGRADRRSGRVREPFSSAQTSWYVASGRAFDMQDSIVTAGYYVHAICAVVPCPLRRVRHLLSTVPRFPDDPHAP